MGSRLQGLKRKRVFYTIHKMRPRSSLLTCRIGNTLNHFRMLQHTGCRRLSKYGHIRYRRLTERQFGLRIVTPLLEFYVRPRFSPSGSIEPICPGEFDDIQK